MTILAVDIEPSGYKDYYEDWWDFEQKLQRATWEYYEISIDDFTNHYPAETWCIHNLDSDKFKFVHDTDSLGCFGIIFYEKEDYALFSVIHGDTFTVRLDIDESKVLKEVDDVWL